MKQEENNKPTENGNVNILYFTTKCNLDCTYCYEDLGNKEKKSTSLEDLKKQVDEIIATEPIDTQTLFVLFGGEPTLEWDNVKGVVDYAYSKKQNVFFNLETNGIKFLDQTFLDDYLDFFKNKPHSLDISFDGIGNHLRQDHKGNDSTQQLLDVLHIFKELPWVNWRIRYTITKANFKDFASDVVKLGKSFGPRRIITSEDSDSFTQADYYHINKQKTVLKHLWDTDKLDIPICNIFCDNCTGCESSKANKRYYKDGQMVDSIEVKDNQGEFSHFKTKKGK